MPTSQDTQNRLAGQKRERKKQKSDDECDDDELIDKLEKQAK